MRDMKKHFKIVYISLLLLFTALSCEQFQEVSKVDSVESLSTKISVNLKLGDAPKPEKISVKLINYTERYELTTTMTPDETIVVDDIIPGIYTITLTSEMNLDGFTYNYSGNVVNKEIVADNREIKVEVGASKSGALLFKEIFYCGSKTPTGGSYFRDQFYEIYNNSEAQQNVRGLAIAILNPLTSTANLPVWGEPDADDYVYALQIWQVPDDQDYPLQPGESIIIAQMADNHQKASLNPSSPVNLLSAEFETLVNTTAIILDNPAINMEMAFWPKPTAQWLTTVFGGAFVIWFPQEPIDPTNTVSPVGSTAESIRIAIADVVDAVEIVKNENEMQLKRVPAVLDAGATTVGATYATQSIARKVKEINEEGRVILKDSNNSTEDFEVMDLPVIRRYGAKAPLWNTWK